jgi:dCTP deaminase
MLLGYKEIKTLLQDRSSSLSERLIISPILDPDDQLKPGTASVDLRLGQRFRVPRRTKLSSLDHLSDEYEASIEKYKDETFVRIGDYFVLHPRQFVLGETLEWVHLPNNISAQVLGRSSWGRDGLIIATATGIHPSYSGIITLEISNIGEIPIHIYPGLAIAQLFLMDVRNAGESQPGQSTFLASTEPRNANPARKDKGIIDGFKKRFKKPATASS